MAVYAADDQYFVGSYNETDGGVLTETVSADDTIEPSVSEDDIIFVNGVSRNKVIIDSKYEVSYPCLLPYSFSKAKPKDFYRLFGMKVSSNGTEYAVTKGKVVGVKIKDGDGTITLDYYLQITGLTLLENGKIKMDIDKNGQKAVKTLAKELNKVTKVDKKVAKTGVGKSGSGIHVRFYPFTLNEENAASVDQGLSDLIFSGTLGKYQLDYSYSFTKEKSKVKNGKKDAQKDLATVTYDKDTGLITVNSCEIQGSIALSSNQITNKAKDTE
ncbi:MAG: hypothetical protein K5989_12555 [Lachnospiraceae bacterium]|nr:hypothetical protein [Lachnospiraceae bacterium]